MSDATETPAADPTAAAPTTRTYEAVAAGRRWNGSELVVLWFPLRDDGTPDTDRPLRFSIKGKKTKLTDPWTGGVYLLEEDTADRKFGVKGYQIRSIPDTALAAKWRAEERAAEATAELEKAQKKAGFDDLTLADLRTMYRKTIGSARQAGLLAAVIQHVTG